MTPKIDLSALVRLQRQRRGTGWTGGAPLGDGRLVEATGFGANPGDLRMLSYAPPGLPRGAPLVVALHGCTQTASGFDVGCGWSDMADRSGFALLMPEQRRANNAQLCFDWFEPGDTGRDLGEVLSIRQMIEAMIDRHGLDRSRVFVTGLSAGGAMAAAMLATYPEVFAAGAIVAGLPYGSARGVGEALKAMAHPAPLTAAARGDAVRRASGYRGPWPRVAIWHGDADKVVHPDNAAESAKQWLSVHGLADAAPRQETGAAGHAVRRWTGADGRTAVALHSVAGLGHGVPLAPGREEGRCGRAAPYLLDAGLSSTHEILHFWGLETGGAALPEAEIIPPGGKPAPRAEAPSPMGGEIGGVIEKALRAAGLMGR